jgi:hypothetical protein
VLLVPLAVSAPRAVPRPGQAIVLAAGAPRGSQADVGPADDGAAQATSDGSGASDEPATAPKLPTRRRAAARVAALGRRPSTSTTTASPGAAAPAAAAPAAPTVVAARAVVAAAPALPAPPAARPPAPAAAPAPPSAADAVWDRLALCESSNTNDPSAPYYGYWQFSAGTWHSVGETGLPSDFPRGHQLAAAKRLQAASGWAPWPDCSRRLGLR